MARVHGCVREIEKSAAVLRLLLVAYFSVDLKTATITSTGATALRQNVFRPLIGFVASFAKAYFVVSSSGIFAGFGNWSLDRNWIVVIKKSIELFDSVKDSRSMM